MADDEIKQLEEELKKLEETEKKLESGDFDFSAPQAQDKDSVYKFFREVLQSDDSTKTGNLDEGELKILRAYQHLGLFAESQDLDLVSEYMIQKGEVLASTSDSKKGFLAQLFVTQIKKQQNIGRPTEAARKRFWQFGKPVEQTEEER